MQLALCYKDGSAELINSPQLLEKPDGFIVKFFKVKPGKVDTIGEVDINEISSIRPVGVNHG